MQCGAGVALIGSMDLRVPARVTKLPPLVSVIMPTRGRPDLIRIAIQSVLAQAYERWELIIINDGGTDIADVVAAHNGCGRIVYLHLPRPRGAAAARNAGIAIARGTYIAYLDDDDWYDERHLATLVDALEQGDDVVAYSDSRRIVEVERAGRFRATSVQEPYYAVPFSRGALLVNNYIPILALVHRRDVMDQVGMFDESFEVLEDWELWIRMSQKVDFRRVPVVTCNVRWREDGSTTTTGRRRDHYPCAKRIHEKYAEQVAGARNVTEARERLLACLEPAYRNIPPTCSIVIAATNAECSLRDCLAAIASVTQGVSYEVVVVDNGSRDGTVRLLTEADVDAKIVVLPNAVPLGEALQRGVNEATGRFLVFMSADDIVREYWLRALVEDAELHPESVAISGKLLDVCGAVADAGGTLTSGEVVARHVGARAWDPQVSRRSRIDVASGVTLVRREAFDTIGGLDPSFETMLAVGDLCCRAAALGDVVLQPASVLYATGAPEEASAARDRDRLAHKANLGRTPTAQLPNTVSSLSRPSLQAEAQAEPEKLVADARAAMVAKQLDRAAEIIVELERIAPRQVETFLARGVLQLQLGDNEQALASFAEAVELGSEGHRASLGVGMALVSSGRNLEAWNVLDALATRHPEVPEVTHMLFRVGTMLERWNDLVDPLERYLDTAHDDLAIRFATASVCVRRGDYARARRHYETLKGRDPGYGGLQDLARELTARA